MRIALDAMGGDQAPNEIVAGALQALPPTDQLQALFLELTGGRCWGGEHD